jgi:Spy/CpxP family protein refolding chaperone
MRKHLIATIILVLALGLMQSVSFAEKRGGYDHGRHHKKSIKAKFFKKVKMVYLYQDELNINDSQLDQIRELKIALKKDVIKKQADLDIIKVDIRSLLYEDEIDVEAVNKHIDQKYEIKKAKTKKVVKSYAQLKKILTNEQIEKLKEIARDQKKMYKPKGSPMRGLMN